MEKEFNKTAPLKKENITKNIEGMKIKRNEMWVVEDVKKNGKCSENGYFIHYTISSGYCIAGGCKSS